MSPPAALRAAALAAPVGALARARPATARAAPPRPAPGPAPAARARRAPPAARARADDADYLAEEAAEEAAEAEVDTGGAPWAETALACARDVLGGPDLGDCALYSFRAVPSAMRVDVRLDKLTDRYGSPTLDDVETFSRKFNAALDAALGEEAAGGIECEVSSPGAERVVAVPRDLGRFRELPMRVDFEDGAGGADSQVLQVREWDDERTVWGLANVRANRTVKGKATLSRKQRDLVFEIPVARISRARLHVDF